MYSSHEETVLAPGVRLVRIINAGACTREAGVTCQWGTLAAGAQVTARIVVQVLVVGQVSNTAWAEANEAEANLDNNQATATVSVQPGPPPPPPPLNDIPALDVWGVRVLALLLAGLGGWRLRRRKARAL